MGRTKSRKREKRKLDRTCTPGGEAEEEEMFPHLRKPAVREISWDRKGVLGFRGEHSNRQASESKTYMDGLCHSLCAPA